jgi:hypothetical protein
MTILLTDTEREQAAHFASMRGQFPVLSETEREQRWHRKIHIPSLLSTLTQRNAGRAIACSSCGTRNVGMRRNGTPRSWWMDVDGRRILCWGCRRNQAGRFVRFIPSRGWGFASYNGQNLVMRTTDFDDLWINPQGEAFMIWNSRTGRYINAGHSDITFRTIREARTFANAYGASDRSEAALRRLLNADTRCLSFYCGQRCRLSPNHPGQHRSWSRSNPDFRWY